MTRALVTGCAGFIGSHLSERLLADGHQVVGVDAFTDYYERELKESNLFRLRKTKGFELRSLDLSEDSLDGLLDGIDVVYHLAGQAGVRASFGDGFGDYLRHNVLATQRLLEAAEGQMLRKFVYASSSSVYGDQATYPTDERSTRAPVSPYGITKAATEDLAAVYHHRSGLPVVGLRYFTVYGPRQRPDMAFTRFIHRALLGHALPVFGDVRQVRDFTFVDDIVDGTVRAAASGRPGSVYNIGGGEPTALRSVIEIIGELTGQRLNVAYEREQDGEARRTSADCTLAIEELGFTPHTSIRDGLEQQIAWVHDGLAAVPRRSVRAA